MEDNRLFCPKCGSTDISTQLLPIIFNNYKKRRGLGWWILIGWWWWIVDLIIWLVVAIPIFIIRLSTKDENNTSNNSIAVCNSCNHSWNLIQNVKYKKSLQIFTLIVLVFLLFICTSLSILIKKEQSGYFIADTVEPSFSYTDVAQTVVISMTLTSDNDINKIHTQVAGTMLAEAVVASTMTPSPTVIQKEVTKENNDDLIIYLSGKYQQLFDCSDILDALSFEFTYISENPDALFNDSIMSNIYSELDQFKLLCTNFYEEEVPNEAASVNEYFKLIDEEYLACYDDLIYGFQYFDFDSIDDATTHMTNATNYFSLATDEIEKIINY